MKVAMRRIENLDKRKTKEKQNFEAKNMFDIMFEFLNQICSNCTKCNSRFLLMI